MPKRRRNGPVKVGPPKVKIVAKIRRTQEQAYGSRAHWDNMRLSVKQRDNNRCRKCSSTEYLQVDHIVPVSKGGQTVMSNLWTLCDRCHSKRPGHKQAKALILHKRNKAQQKPRV